jgi:hypothetical protein
MPAYKLSNKSSTSLKSELEFFQVPPTQTCVVETIPIELQPTNALTHTGPYDFRVPADNLMLDVFHNELYMRVRIVDNANAALLAPGGAVAHPAVAPINMLGKCFFNHVKLFVNNKLVEDSGDKYAYRAFFETELNFNYDAKTTHLQSALYIEDDPANMNVAANVGLLAREVPFHTSAEVELVGKIHCDLFNQEKCLPSNIDLRLELHRNTDAFCLLCYTAAAPAYKLEVLDMRWKVWKVRPSEEFALALERIVLSEPMKFPIRRVQMTSLHVDAGRRHAPNNAIITGQIPRRIILGMVNANGYLGSQTQNPFNFGHNNISSISLQVSGRTVPAYDIPIDVANGRFLRHYCDLMNVLDISNTNKGNTLSTVRYRSGSTFFAFDLSPDHDPEGGHWDLVREGSVSLNITFSVAIPAPGIEIVIYSEYENMIEFDRLRSVTYDYSA